MILSEVYDVLIPNNHYGWKLNEVEWKHKIFYLFIYVLLDRNSILT